MDQQLNGLMKWLGTVLGESSSHLTSALHVLEYLLRRYDVHVRNAEALLVYCGLPYHDQPFFLRLLQLLDLTQQQQTFLFLRPFAPVQKKKKKSTTTTNNQDPLTPARSLLAKRVAKDKALLKLVCQIADNAACGPYNQGRRGVAHCIRFAGAVLAEGMALQARDKGTLEEATVRVLLPYIAKACRGTTNRTDNNDEWRGFGYVLATCLTEHCQLGPTALSKLSNAIIHNQLPSSQVHDSTVDALVTLMAILPKETACSLPTIPQSGRNKLSARLVRGFELDSKSFRQLSANAPTVAKVLGIAYQDRGLHVASMVVALWTGGLKQQKWSVLGSLLQEPSLSEVWKESHLVTPCCVSVLRHVVGAADNNLPLEDCKEILVRLKSLDSMGWNNGVTHVVTKIPRKKSGVKRRVAHVLGIAVPTENAKDNDGQEEGEEEEGGMVEDTSLLPPRVALEHASVEVRLRAMEQLLDEKSWAQEDPQQGGTEPLEAALVRHVMVEDDVAVAYKAATVLKAVATDRAVQMDASEELCEQVLQSIIKWNAKVRKQKKAVKLVSILLHVAALAFKGSQRSESARNCGTALLQIIVSLLGESKLETQAASAISAALELTVGDKIDKVKASMVTSGVVCEMIRQPFNDNVPMTFQIQSLEVFVAAATTMLQSDPKDSVAKDATTSCLYLLEARSQHLPEPPSLITTCLTLSLQHVKPAELLSLIEDIVKIKSDLGFEQVCAPALDALATASSNPMSIYLETATRDGLDGIGVIRLLKAVENLVDRKSTGALVPTLSLLAHVDQNVRRAARDFCSTLMSHLKGDLGQLFGLVAGARKNGSMGSSLIMDGAIALPRLLQAATKQAKHPSKLRKAVLQQCVSIVGDVQSAIGGTHAAAVVLCAVELAGEDAFPLSDRWTFAGKPLLASLSGMEQDVLLEPSTKALLHAVVRMLKGAVVNDATSLYQEESSLLVASSSRRSSGGRSRSYSVSSTNGVEYLTGYPSDMVSAITDCLAKEDLDDGGISRELCAAVLEEVVGRQSWGHTIFRTLKPTERIEVASGLLALQKSVLARASSGPFLGLCMEPSEVQALLTKFSSDLPSATAILDYIRTNSARLASSQETTELMTELFDFLDRLSSKQVVVDDDESEYTRLAILGSLLALAKEVGNAKDLPSLLTKDDVSSRTDMLVGLVGSLRSAVRYRPLLSWRGRKLALGLLTELCPIYPESVVERLIPALMSSAATSGSENLTATRDAFMAVVPVFHAHASAADLSLFDLFKVLVDEITKMESVELIMGLQSCVADALLSITANADTHPFGAYIATYLAMSRVRSSDTNANSLSSVLERVQRAAPFAMAGATRQLIEFSRLMLDVKDATGTDAVQTLVSLVTDKKTTSKQQGILNLVEGMVYFVASAVSSADFDRFVRTANHQNAELCLQIWQELLLLQAKAMSDEDDVNVKDDSEREQLTKVLVRCRNGIDGCLASLQRSLPAPLFLASTLALINDGSSPELQSRSLRFLAERIATLDAFSAEATLFLDTVSTLAEHLRPKDAENHEQLIVKQATAVAVEQLARTLGPSPDIAKSHKDGLLNALQGVTGSLDRYAVTLSNDKKKRAFRDTKCQVCCSLALSGATLVRVFQARCLPFLPKLMEASMKLLSLTVDWKDSKNNKDNEVVEQVVAMVRASFCRLLIAVTDSIPQFLAPYLTNLLSPKVRLSMAQSDELLQLIAGKVQARKLIPAIHKALSDNVQSVSSFLPMLMTCIKGASRSDLTSVHSKLLNTLLLALSVDDVAVLKDVNAVLLEWVLKMSEAQLQPLYFRLREWKDADEEARLHAFCSVSAALARELRSIYVQACLSADDLVPPLEKAVGVLCASAGSSSKKASKKAKLVSDKVASLQYLPSLLACIAHALQADAREGGQWCRTEERYASLMEPLSKLLQCRVPADFFRDSESVSTTPYQRLVVSNETDRSTDGTVVDCLVALATAAGDETLWKPLTHEILQACGHEDRAEVRKAGVTCLLGLIKTLGEEFMVLLPECLPYLAELLESEDEETVALAQECVSLSEGLLGESLQDSLR